MRRRRRPVAWLLGTALAAAATVLLLTGGGGGGGGDLPRPAPPLAGSDLGGQRHDLRDLRGSVVLVTAWASWCDPCRDEVPVLDEAVHRYGGDGLEVLGLNVQDRPEHARAFVEAEQPRFSSVVDHDGTRAVEWGLRGLPETFLVDRDGLVVAHRFGAVTREWVEDVVRPVVEQ